MTSNHTLATRLHIASISPRLFLVTISKDSLDFCVKPIMNLAFFKQSETFFSYTETEDEVSLLLDEPSLQYLQNSLQKHNNVLVTSPGCWKGIQVAYEGPDQLNEIGLISSLSASLTECGIPTLYLSQHKSDLILVQEDAVEKAVAQLSSRISSTQNLEQRFSTKAGKSQPSKIVVSTLPESLYILSAKDSSLLPNYTHSLLKEFFFPQNCKRLFSFTSSPSETSIIMSTDSMCAFPSTAFDIVPACWKAIHVGSEGSLGFSGNNVSLISGILARANVSLIYLSTFHTDFILVPGDQLESTLTSLRQSLHIITED